MPVLEGLACAFGGEFGFESGGDRPESVSEFLQSDHGSEVGDVFICADKQAAQAVTFNRNVRVSSVTLEGDVYDPSGTLSGGAAPNSSGILVQVQELNKVQREVDACRRSMDELDREMQSNAKELEAFRRDKRTLELRVHEVGLLQEQVQGSTAAKVSGLLSTGFKCFLGVFAFSSAASHSTFSD